MGCCQDISTPKMNPTKIYGWKEKVIILYFQEKLSISEIASKLEMRLPTISEFLSKHPEYAEEKEQRKKVNKERRKEYQRNWDRFNRKRPTSEESFIEGSLLKRQHMIDVIVLSADRH